MNLRELIEKTFKTAWNLPIQDDVEPIKKHRIRSEFWVCHLAENLKSFIDPDDSNNKLRIFSKSNDQNQKDFRRNEFLYDIVACEISKTPSFKEINNKNKTLMSLAQRM